jgi:hypothetical protein
LSYCRVEFKFVYERLKRANVRVSGGFEHNLRIVFTDIQPLISVPTKFFWGKLPSSGMSFVVAMDLCVAFETNRNGIFNRIDIITI